MLCKLASTLYMLMFKFDMQVLGLRINKGGKWFFITLFYCLLALGTSCSSPRENAHREFRLVTSPETLNLSGYFKNISIQTLISENPIGTVDKVLLTESNILISDFHIMKSLKVFDKKGDLQASRDDIGEGPLGLSEITDFGVYLDTVYVLDAHRRKIMRFTLGLEPLDEFYVPIPCSNFVINKEGIFILRQGSEANSGRIVQFSHEMKMIHSVLPMEEANTTLVISDPNLFTEINDSVFVFSHPFYPNLWICKNGGIEKIELNFKGEFLDVNILSKKHPLDGLKFVNEFDGFYNLTNGTRLSDSEILFSIRYRKKNGYLLVNLKTREMTFIENIKNDLGKVPSAIQFSGNSSREAWYWMDQNDIQKFYNINSRKIPGSDRIQMSDDKESKIIFHLEYK